jgi:hypothetical protein
MLSSMSNTNLIVAIVFAGLFGAALVWLAVYYMHRYIHLRCLELDHWFHILTPPAWRSSCRHCEGTGKIVKAKEKSRLSSRQGQERSTSRGRRDKAQNEKGQRIFEADTEYNAIGQESNPGQRSRPALPSSSSVQSPGGEQQYNPWQGQLPGAQQLKLAYRQPAMYPQTYQQPFQQSWPQHVTSFTMPAPMPQQQTVYVPVPVPSAVSSMPAYRKPLRKAYTERSDSQADRKASKEGSRARRTDYIHIVDDYPPIVKERMKKAAPTQVSSSSPSSSSTSTSSAEDVPRASIPRTARHFTEAQALQFPQHPHLTTRIWDAPTSHPRQWTGNAGGGGPNGQARYVSSYTRPEGRTLRRHVPSNTSLRHNTLF